MDPTIEIAVRLAAFAAVFAVMAAWELLAPRRELSVGRQPRWPGNLGIVIVDALAVRLIMPTAAAGTALIAAERGWGLLNMLATPGWLAAILGFLLLDLLIYAQHVVFHHVPVLWRLHRMHHADLDIDVTTGGRFHPIEILLSMLIKIAAVLAFGIPAIAVVIFEVALNATSMFNHSNVAMPERLDRIVRWLVVTPDMHRVHHSIERRETDSNFGFNLPWWDRLFGTYRSAPAAGHVAMTLGIPIFRDRRELRLDRLLTQPFRNDQAAEPVSARSRAGAAADVSDSVGSVKPS
ncbi:MAG: sterol desaturase family protein [Xanthobacteraceae bacterium]|jgi:sterol desaturase/sphingolipid hydroxylase (fatty acid hydroxylase superfamily)